MKSTTIDMKSFKMEEIDAKKVELFQQIKNSTLNREDLSLKGSIDEPIRPLVNLINENPYYYTTSTCSGRITLIEKPHGQAGLKKGSNFLLSSHGQVELDNLNQVIKSVIDGTQTTEVGDDNKCLWLKFEPFIMHIQCFDLNRAHSLLNIALASGCRNSGITLGKPNKFMLAIRSTSSMEVPVSCGLQFESLTVKYIEFLCDECNRRMTDNFSRLNKLQQSISSFLLDMEKQNVRKEDGDEVSQNKSSLQKT